MPMRSILSATLVVLLSVACRSALAQSGPNHCTLTVTPLTFGSYKPALGVPTDISATLTVTCTTAAPAPVVVHAAIGRIGDLYPGLRNGHDTLQYRLYTDPARSIPWGDGSGGTATVVLSGLVRAGATFRQTATVYGRILAHQSRAAVGAYVDQVTAILTY